MSTAVESTGSIAGGESPARPGIVLGLAGLAVTAAYAPMLIEHFVNIWAKPHYQFYPFALAAFAALFYTRLREATPRAVDDRRSLRPATAMALVAWALLGLSYPANSPWFAAISAALAIAAVILAIQSRWHAPGLWATWAILWLVIPPPLNRDQYLIAYLQRVSSKLSSWWLDWLGVHHLMEGNTLTLAGKQLFVDEACSGIISVMSLIACAVIYGVWRRRSPLQIVTLALCGVVWAVITNVFRIVVIAAAYEWFGLDWSAGAVHEILSLVVFTVAFGGLVSTDCLVEALISPVRLAWEEHAGTRLRFGSVLATIWDACFPAETKAAPAATSHPLRKIQDIVAGLLSAPSVRRGVATLTIAFGTLAVAQAYYWTRSSTVVAADDADDFDRQPEALALKEDFFPEELGAFRRVSFAHEERERGDLFGDHSLVYRFQDAQQREAVVSCSFPFHDAWHDLTVCYSGAGWQPVRQQPLAEEGDADARDKWTMVAEFARPDGMQAYLAYRYFDAQGNWVEPPHQGFASEAFRQFGKRELTKRFAQRFQIQVLVVDGNAIDAKRQAAANELLAEASERFRQAISTGAPVPPQASSSSADDGAGTAEAGADSSNAAAAKTE